MDSPFSKVHGSSRSRSCKLPYRSKSLKEPVSGGDKRKVPLINWNQRNVTSNNLFQQQISSSTSGKISTIGAKLALGASSIADLIRPLPTFTMKSFSSLNVPHKDLLMSIDNVDVIKEGMVGIKRVKSCSVTSNTFKSTYKTYWLTLAEITAVTSHTGNLDYSMHLYSMSCIEDDDESSKVGRENDANLAKIVILLRSGYWSWTPADGNTYSSHNPNSSCFTSVESGNGMQSQRRRLRAHFQLFTSKLSCIINDSSVFQSITSPNPYCTGYSSSHSSNKKSTCFNESTIQFSSPQNELMIQFEVWDKLGNVSWFEHLDSIWIEQSKAEISYSDSLFGSSEISNSDDGIVFKVPRSSQLQSTSPLDFCSTWESNNSKVDPTLRGIETSDTSTSISHPSSDDEDMADEKSSSNVAVSNWRSTVPDKSLELLSRRQLKRQDVINELFTTERSHVRTLKVLQRVFYRPLLSNPHLVCSDFVQRLFPNLDDILSWHTLHDKRMRLLVKTDGYPVNNIHNILSEMFDGEVAARKLIRIGSLFTRNQKLTIEELKEKRKRDNKLDSFLCEQEKRPECRRLQLQSILPSEHQRLVKYPLLLEQIVKNTDTEEVGGRFIHHPSLTSQHERLSTGDHDEVRDIDSDLKNLSATGGVDDITILQRCLESTRHILECIDNEVAQCQNKSRLEQIQKNLDTSGLEKLPDSSICAEYRHVDLSTRKLIYDGPLTMKLGDTRRFKTIDLHVLLLEDSIMLLQKNADDKTYFLKFHSGVNSGGSSSSIQHSNPIMGSSSHQLTSTSPLSMHVSGSAGHIHSNSSSMNSGKLFHSPIIKFSTMLVRPVATDARAFYLLNTTQNGPQIYELIASSTADRSQWFRHISEASNAFKLRESTASSSKKSSIGGGGVSDISQHTQIASSSSTSTSKWATVDLMTIPVVPLHTSSGDKLHNMRQGTSGGESPCNSSIEAPYSRSSSNKLQRAAVLKRHTDEVRMTFDADDSPLTVMKKVSSEPHVPSSMETTAAAEETPDGISDLMSHPLSSTAHPMYTTGGANHPSTMRSQSFKESRRGGSCASTFFSKRNDNSKKISTTLVSNVLEGGDTDLTSLSVDRSSNASESSSPFFSASFDERLKICDRLIEDALRAKFNLMCEMSNSDRNEESISDSEQLRTTETTEESPNVLQTSIAKIDELNKLVSSSLCDRKLMLTKSNFGLSPPTEAGQSVSSRDSSTTTTTTDEVQHQVIEQQNRERDKNIMIQAMCDLNQNFSRLLTNLFNKNEDNDVKTEDEFCKTVTCDSKTERTDTQKEQRDKS